MWCRIGSRGLLKPYSAACHGPELQCSHFNNLKSWPAQRIARLLEVSCLCGRICLESGVTSSQHQISVAKDAWTWKLTSCGSWTRLAPMRWKTSRQVSRIRQDDFGWRAWPSLSKSNLEGSSAGCTRGWHRPVDAAE